MKQTARFGTVVATLLASTLAAHAAMAGYKASDIIIRARAVQIQFYNHTNTAALSGVGADNKMIPEVDGTYFFTRNIAAELILTYPQTISVHPGIGSLKALPPTLMAQYHFMPDSPFFRPYVGVGVNNTR
ncbi:MAG: OmpW/AlkL family protein, partial [Acidiferrobacter sp.]